MSVAQIVDFKWTGSSWPGGLEGRTLHLCLVLFCARAGRVLLISYKGHRTAQKQNLNE